MITGDPRGTTSQDRVRGFVERLLEEGFKRSHIEEAAGGSTYDGAVKAARDCSAPASSQARCAVRGQ